MRWVSMPNKMDGKGYRRVAAHERATDICCAWVLIVEVASKMPVRGVLRDEDGPVTAEDMAFMTGFPEQIFGLAFLVLAEPKIGWLESCGGVVAEPPEVSGRHPEPSGLQDRTRQDTRTS